MSHLILLCDDEPHILRAASIKLSRAGYQVIAASDGQEAWEQIVRRVPDLLVTDCQMPRLNGFELCERVRQHVPSRDLPIVMLTAKGFEVREEEVRERWGVERLMAKPFSPRELRDTIDSILTERRRATIAALGYAPSHGVDR